MDESGGESGVESMSLSERESMWCSLCGAIHLTALKSSSQLLAQTSHPPTRNLFGKTHEAGDDGANDDAIDDGVLNDADRLPKSMMKMSATTIRERAR